MAGIFKGFSFQIVSTQPRQIPLDPRIGDTIAAIILRFLDQNPNAALFFIHDAADGRARGRKRTFDSWLKRLRLHEFLKKDDEIIVGRFTVLVSIVLRKNHPHSLQITEAFDQLIVDASEKPED